MMGITSVFLLLALNVVFINSEAKAPRSMCIKLEQMKTLDELKQYIHNIPNDTRYASALTEMARPDTCSPRLTTVEIPKPKEYNHFFWPTCTRVKRCGGCAGDDSLKCVPTANGKINQKVHVVRVVFPYPGASSFEWNGINAIELEAHKECKEVCKISEADCRDELHIYSEADCSCRCKTSTIAKCSHPKFWDEKTCSCICPKIKACDHGLRFSKKVCMCVHDNRGSKFASANASFIMPNGESKSGSNQVDSNRITNNAKGPSERKNAERNALNSPTSEVPKKGVDLMNLLTTEENSRAAVTRTTTTTVKTTTTTKKVNKCGFKKCPFLWVPVLQRNGICGCKPNFG